MKPRQDGSPWGKVMLGYTSKHLLALLAAIVCVMTITSLLLMHFIPAPPSQFSIATGRSHQIYEGIGNQYREILARSHVDLNIRLTNGALENIGLLNDPASGIKAGIVQGGISNTRSITGSAVAGTYQLSDLLDLLQGGRHARRSEAAQGQARRAGAAGQRPASDDRADTGGERRQFRKHDAAGPDGAGRGQWPQRWAISMPCFCRSRWTREFCMAC